MRELLTILGPGDPLPSEGDAIMIVDDQIYGGDVIRDVATRVECGPSVVQCDDGFRLTESAREAVESVTRVEGHVLFFATDDTHVNTFLRLAPLCRKVTFVVPHTVDLHSRARLEREGIEYVVHRRGMVELREADLAVMGNDNAKEERLFIHHCRQFDVPVVSLQEAVNVYFESGLMSWADRTFISGLHALRYHDRQFCILTGNPRYDDIHPQPLPTDPYVLINCNFTYGIGEGWSRTWLDQTINAATRVGVPYRITVHPRDETDLSDVENILDSNAFVVHEQIAGCYVLVSRDSSLPYEALQMNRHVVYYNPFHEIERCLNEDDTGLINKADDADTLATLLRDLRNTTLPQDDHGGLAKTFQTYFTGIDGRNHLRVMRAMHVMIDGEYHQHSDARQDPYVVAWSQVMLQNVLRPRLRRIGVLRSVWRFFKYRVFRYPSE